MLHLSEHAAYGRIEAARAARRYPIVLDLLADGSVTLTAVTLLAPHLTAANHRALLGEARHKSKRDVEHIVARLRPQPPVAATVRKLPAPTPPVALTAPVSTGADSRDERPVLSAPLASPPRATVTPLAPERYKVQFTVSRDTHDKLRRVQDLLRHSIPNGDPAAIFDRALTLLLADLERAKLAATDQAASGAADAFRLAPHSGGGKEGGVDSVTAASARSLGRLDGAPRQGSSSFTT